MLCSFEIEKSRIVCFYLSPLILSEIYAYHAIRCNSVQANLFTNYFVSSNCFMFMVFIILLSVVWSLYANAYLSAVSWFSACQFAIVLFILCCYYHLLLMKNTFNKQQKKMTIKRQKEFKKRIEEYGKAFKITLICGGLIWFFLFSVKSYTTYPSLGTFWYVWVLLIVSIALCARYYREEKETVGIHIVQIIYL